jgi:hypothetical protein
VGARPAAAVRRDRGLIAGAPVADRLLAPFLLRVFAWLAPMFLVWWFAAPILAWPVSLLVQGVMRAGFGTIVQSVEQSGEMITFVTSLAVAGIAAPSGARAVLEVESNYRLFSFGLPLFAAMTLAARAPDALRNLAIGYAVLLPIQLFCVLADFFKNLAGVPGVAAQMGLSPLQREIIAFSYQFATLILPTVAPAVVWVLLHRRFLEAFAGTAPHRRP